PTAVEAGGSETELRRQPGVRASGDNPGTTKESLMLKPLIALAGASVLVAACADDPHTTNTTLGGAALGAVAGAVVGNNLAHGSTLGGAAIGAAIGGAAGAV